MRTGRFFAIFLWLAGLAMIEGSAGSPPAAGGQGPERDRSATREIRSLVSTLERDSSDWKSRRNLAFAYLRSGVLDSAEQTCRRVLETRPNDPRTLFLLGAVYEAREDYESALGVYRRYIDLGRLSTYRKRIEQRLGYLIRLDLKSKARELVRNEAELLQREPDPVTLAVPEFTCDGDDARLLPLGAAVSEWITTDLGSVGRLRIVERLRWNAVLQELSLEDRAALDESSVPRLGRIVGAARLVTGAVTPLPGDRIRIDLRIVSVETGAAGPELHEEGALADVSRMEKDLVFSVLEKLAVQPTPLERARIQEVPTRSLAAATAFGAGLMADRRGDLSEARSFYARAVDLDGGFGLATARLASLPRSDDFAHFVESAMIESAMDDRPTDDTLQRDRLAETDQLTGGGLWPDPAADSPVFAPMLIPEPPVLPGLSGKPQARGGS